MSEDAHAPTTSSGACGTRLKPEICDSSESSRLGFFSERFRLYDGASIVETSAAPCDDSEFARRIVKRSFTFFGEIEGSIHDASASRPWNAVAVATRNAYGSGTI